MVILKFGGTSVATPEAIERVVHIVARVERPRLVVVSALAGVTDQLLEAASRAAAGDPGGATLRLRALRLRHEQTAIAVACGRRPTPSRPSSQTSRRR